MPMRVSKVQTLRTQATEVLRDAIVVGTLAPASLHSEQSIAVKIGISRTPIREALLQLSSEGLVEFLPQRGVRITSIDPERLSKIFEYRSALDAFCVDALARSPDAQIIHSLDEQLARQKRIISKEDRLEWVRANMDFHRAIVDSIANPMMSDTMSLLGHHTMRVGYRMLHDRKRMKESFGEHVHLVDAIRNSQPTQARQLALKHLAFTASRLKEMAASEQSDDD
jgi:DNA-binding GntR family transcriptional regulator